MKLNRSGIYKNSTGSNQYDPETGQAVSYNWWRYADIINGKRVFNDYYYSPTTCMHQSKLRRILPWKHFQYIFECPAGFQSPDRLKSIVEHLNSKILRLQNQIGAPGSHRAKNTERFAEIQELKKTQAVATDLFNA